MYSSTEAHECEENDILLYFTHSAINHVSASTFIFMTFCRFYKIWYVSSDIPLIGMLEYKLENNICNTNLYLIVL